MIIKRLISFPNVKVYFVSTINDIYTLFKSFLILRQINQTRPIQPLFENLWFCKKEPKKECLLDDCVCCWKAVSFCLSIKRLTFLFFFGCSVRSEKKRKISILNFGCLFTGKKIVISIRKRKFELFKVTFSFDGQKKKKMDVNDSILLIATTKIHLFFYFV